MKFEIGDIVHCDNERSWFFEYYGMIIDVECATKSMTVSIHANPSDVYIVQLWNKPQIVQIPSCHLKKYQLFYKKGTQNEISNRR